MRKLVLLIGPTCSGKSTLEQALNKLGVPSVTSYTTRPPRAGEIDGVHYQFLSQDAVSKLDATGQIVQRVEFAGNLYGSTLPAIAKAYESSNIAVIVVEPTGLLQFQNYAATTSAFEVISVYVNGALSELIARLIQRFDQDSNADAAYYWRRLIQQYEAFHEWPHYTSNWDIVFDQVDDAVPGKTVSDAARTIMAATVR